MVQKQFLDRMTTTTMNVETGTIALAMIIGIPFITLGSRGKSSKGEIKKRMKKK